MKKNIITIITLFCAISGFQRTFAQSDYKLGGLPGVATRMGFGARAIGMANALTAVKNGEAIGYYNPALVPFQPSPSALIAVGFLPLDRNLNFLNYSQSLKPSGGVSLGIINSGVSNLEGRSRDGVVTETYSTSENVGIFSFGTKVDDRIALGISAKIFYYSLFEDVKSTTVGFDIGFLYSMTEEWTVGLVLQDINSKYKWDTSQLYGRDGNTTIERFPLRKRIAVSYSPQFLSATVSTELELIGSTLLNRFGVEAPLYEGFAVRGGIDQIAFEGNINAKPSFGFSLQTPIEFWRPAVHYAYVIEPYSSGGLHFITIKLTFE